MSEELRESVQWFAEQMEKKLQEHDDKGGWDEEGEDYFLRRAQQELKELKEALVRFEDEGIGMGHSSESNYDDFTLKEEVVREAADVANFMMMLAWRFRKVTT